MQHLSSPAQTRTFFRVIIHRIRAEGAHPLTLPWLTTILAENGNGPVEIVLALNAIAQFTDLDDESEVITIQAPYERHDDETLARMVWQQLLKGACQQHPAHS